MFVTVDPLLVLAFCLFVLIGIFVLYEDMQQQILSTTIIPSYYLPENQCLSHTTILMYLVAKTLPACYETARTKNRAIDRISLQRVKKREDGNAILGIS